MEISVTLLDFVSRYFWRLSIYCPSSFIFLQLYVSLWSETEGKYGFEKPTTYIFDEIVRTLGTLVTHFSTL